MLLTRLLFFSTDKIRFFVILENEEFSDTWFVIELTKCQMETGVETPLIQK